MNEFRPHGRQGPGYALTLSILLALQACGGGGGGGTSSLGSGGGSTVPPAIPSATFVPTIDAQQCDPTNPEAAPGTRTGSLALEKQWLLSFVNSSYLWWQDIPAVDPGAAAYTSSLTQLNADNVPVPLNNYFQALKTPQLDSTGAKVDKFSFSYSTYLWNALSQGGQSYGCGASFNIVTPAPPRRIVVGFVQPGTPAAAAGLVRGATIVNVDGIDAVNGNDQADLFSNSCCLPDGSFNCTNTGPLPSLNLSTVYVLTQGDTCSASEAIINGLRGVGVAVKLIGGTTCGKPYGFQPQDNCGVTYFPIQFKKTNAKGFGDYADGFTPDCAVADDYAHAPGAPAEGQLATALGLRSTGSCTAPSGTTVHALSASRTSTGPGLQRRLGHELRSGAWRSK